MIIYRVSNKINGKIYIGLTRYELKRRKSNHIHSSRNPKYHFHKALAKYQEEDFLWEVIDTASNIDDLKKKEIYWINYYNSYKKGYNSTLGGDGNLLQGKDHPFYGKKLSLNHKKNLSLHHADFSGHKSPNSKISNSQAEEIRDTYVTKKVSQRYLAKKYKISQRAIYNIIHKKSYKGI